MLIGVVLSISGVATAVGGLGHTLPYLLPGFALATTAASIVVGIELLAIAVIRKHFMDTPLLRALFGTVVGGLIVFGVGILIGGT